MEDWLPALVVFLIGAISMIATGAYVGCHNGGWRTWLILADIPACFVFGYVGGKLLTLIHYYQPGSEVDLVGVGIFCSAGSVAVVLLFVIVGYIWHISECVDVIFKE